MTHDSGDTQENAQETTPPNSSRDELSDFVNRPPYPREHLTWIQRLAIRIGARLNRPGLARKINVWWGKVFTCSVLYRLTGHRWRNHNIEILELIDDDTPLLIVSNHRTFFDMYVGITALRYATKYRIGTPAFFPVRAPFFYDRLLGIFMNVLFSGGSMWPPIFRGEQRGELNPVSLKIIDAQLTLDGVCLGFHPEGRRSKSDDPYTLEPPKRGVGDLIQRADDRLVIVPLFISGVSDNIKREIKLRKKKYGESDPIHFYWGQPKSARDYEGDNMSIARAVHAEIQALGDMARRAEQGADTRDHAQEEPAAAQG